MSSTTFRPDIQGLRAVAVLPVLIFHIWPGALPGGYIGVDVFFVISGYLITGLLLRELERDGTIGIVRFYGRRVRRLLPASTLVLVTVALLTFTLPPPQWRGVASEVIASALYFENWWLAAKSVNYLAADNAPGPLQHFWSLSIEEQFYFVWPLLMIGMGALGLRRGWRLRPALGAALGVVFAVSLALSVYETIHAPQTAYFVSHTRFWELALGGLLAVAGARAVIAGEAAKIAAATIGLAAIAAAAMLYSGMTAFPGYAALLPTLGAALVLTSGGSIARFAPHRLLESRPAMWIGDISYSIYLWHWPLIVFYRTWTDSIPGLWDGLALLAGSILLAALTKYFVEDRFRGAGSSPAIGRSLAGGLASILLCLVAAGSVFAIIESQRPGELTAQNYPGAAALIDGVPVPAGLRVAPPLALVRDDIADAYSNGCHLDFGETEPRGCVYGAPDGGFHVMLIGDSHAASWLPTLQTLAETRGWRMTAHTKSACPLILGRLEKGPACWQWGENMIAEVARDKPDLVVLAMARDNKIIGEGTREERLPLLIEAVRKTVAALREQGVAVVVMRDTPRFAFDPPECLSRDPECRARMADAFPVPDAMWRAFRDGPGVPVIDMTSGFCADGVCPMIVGNVIVWRDYHHFTATYARTLAPALGRELDRAIAALGIGTKTATKTK
ncbi:acyltransferase family protein [Parvibaculum sp.]|uniref:acyltransferase family protein n=1 Tax=Parvibaculum sp. TaxID=2024848 RepID=UPI0034A029CF